MRLATVPDPDSELEAKIAAELDACEKARNEKRMDDCRKHYDLFVRLIAQRSPKQVSRMERERGLCRPG